MTSPFIIDDQIETGGGDGGGDSGGTGGVVPTPTPTPSPSRLQDNGGGGIPTPTPTPSPSKRTCDDLIINGRPVSRFQCLARVSSTTDGLGDPGACCTTEQLCCYDERNFSYCYTPTETQPTCPPPVPSPTPTPSITPSPSPQPATILVRAEAKPGGGGTVQIFQETTANTSTNTDTLPPGESVGILVIPGSRVRLVATPSGNPAENIDSDDYVFIRWYTIRSGNIVTESTSPQFTTTVFSPITFYAEFQPVIDPNKCYCYRLTPSPLAGSSWTVQYRPCGTTQTITETFGPVGVNVCSAIIPIPSSDVLPPLWLGTECQNNPSICQGPPLPSPSPSVTPTPSVTPPASQPVRPSPTPTPSRTPPEPPGPSRTPVPTSTPIPSFTPRPSPSPIRWRDCVDGNLKDGLAPKNYRQVPYFGPVGGTCWEPITDVGFNPNLEDGLLFTYQRGSSEFPRSKTITATNPSYGKAYSVILSSNPDVTITPSAFRIGPRSNVDFIVNVTPELLDKLGDGSSVLGLLVDITED